MKFRLYPAICAAALLCSGMVYEARLTPAIAQADDAVSFEAFHDQLAPYGDWIYSDRWGVVWVPGDVPDDFHPYDSNGYWADTDDYGWTWVSNYEWGDIPFHYGRWVNDPDDGWLWIPGYVWSPAWVVWRSNGQFTGWMPMPPDPQFLSDSGINVTAGGISFAVNFGNTDGYYGYSNWYGPGYAEDQFAANWIFVGTGHFADRDFHQYEQPRADYKTIIHNTTNITNYTVVNNHIVNKSVDVHAVEQAGGHAIQPVRAASVFHKPQLISSVDQGRQAQTRMRAAAPHGTGVAGSAPKPPPQVVSGLSTKIPQHNGHAPSHVFTRDTVTNAPVGNAAAPAHTPGPQEPRHEAAPDKPAAAPASAPKPSPPEMRQPAQQEMHHPNGAEHGDHLPPPPRPTADPTVRTSPPPPNERGEPGQPEARKPEERRAPPENIPVHRPEMPVPQQVQHPAPPPPAEAQHRPVEPEPPRGAPPPHPQEKPKAEEGKPKPE